jgi:copper chaperone CopZ
MKVEAANYHHANVEPAYLHALEGRLRIKVQEVKGSPALALAVEGQLLALDGIQSVTANPKTGNVLVLYDGTSITQPVIVNALRELGYLQHNGHATHARVAQPHARDTITNVLVRSSVEFALQRLLTALI